MEIREPYRSDVGNEAGAFLAPYPAVLMDEAGPRHRRLLQVKEWER
jgi:hypothetical protein